MDFLTLLAKNKKVVIVLTFFFGAIFLAFTYFMSQTFSGQTTILPPEKQGQSGLMSFLTGSGALDLMKGQENPAIDMFKNVLDSRQLSEQIAKEPRIRRYFATFDTSEKGIAGRFITQCSPRHCEIIFFNWISRFKHIGILLSLKKILQVIWSHIWRRSLLNISTVTTVNV